MDRRTLLAITLCFMIYLGWHKFYIEPRIQQTPVATQPDQGSIAHSEQAPTLSTQTGSQAHPQNKLPAVTLPLETGTGSSILGDGSSFISNWHLKSYKLGLSEEAAQVDLDFVTHQKNEVQLSFDDPHYTYLSDIQGKIIQTPTGALWTYEDAHIKLSREFTTAPHTPYIDTRVLAEFKSRTPRYAFISITAQSHEKDPEAQDRQLLYWSQQNLERIPLKDTVDQKQATTPVKYIAAANRYFLFSVIDQSPVGGPNTLTQPIGSHSGRLSLVYPVSGNSLQIPLRIYFGPKDLNVLKDVEPTLDHTVDFGWFTLIAYPLLKTLKWFYQFVQNYGLAIIFLTVLLKVITFPLNYKSMKSMKNMAKLQPQLQKMREKYKDDKEALNREMLTLMRSHGYNPMAGCFPILIQMPIFFALYRVLYSSIELYHAPFAFWIHDLSMKDPFYITPILVSLTMFVQQKLTPNTATDPAQAKMMQLMPLIFGAFMLTLPSGLALYMLVNAITSIIQQVILNKKLDIQVAK